MEHVISDLLQDFEAGKLTRRQLIQALALGVMAGPAALAAAQKSAESSMPPPRSLAAWKTVWLDHVSYAVSDYWRSTAFYRDVMGWRSFTTTARSSARRRSAMSAASSFEIAQDTRALRDPRLSRLSPV
jgi:hypothetical protein